MMPVSPPHYKEEVDDDVVEEEETYRALVVDSGPIIRRTALTSLWKKARNFYTVPAVLQEIRDAKAREHLDSLPFTLVPKEPSAEAVAKIIAFARQTGDFHSLSNVDIQVLALLYDLEREGTDMSHVRQAPKRVVGVGKIQSLVKEESTIDGQANGVVVVSDQANGVVVVSDHSGVDDDYSVATDDTSEVEEDGNEETKNAVEDELTSPSVLSVQDQNQGSAKLKSWAMIVNPTANGTLSTMNLDDMEKTLPVLTYSKASSESAGQFSDAEEDDAHLVVGGEQSNAHHERLLEDLQSEFPSLEAARLVPYEDGGDHDNDDERKKKALQPISKSGKFYNSFRGYEEILSHKVTPKKIQPTECHDKEKNEKKGLEQIPESRRDNESRIMGGMTLAGQDVAVEDDGKGWISSMRDIQKMKSVGILDPQRNLKNRDSAISLDGRGPPTSQRAACATTDFAMQNVIMQMNLELLSVDGMKVRKLKSWVTRCGACFKVYTSSENEGPVRTKRMFCGRCGSEMMQRIAASVDAKTGRLRLHLKKNFKHNLRGTKFSLPKPGTGNRFQGDLLLREDQLLMGAWHQKAKILAGGKAKQDAQSIFGKDIASNVGCHSASMTSDSIRVGFGRRNPNAAKGRERRGKKKKSSDKACGLRRY